MKMNKMTDYAIQIIQILYKHEGSVITSKQIAEEQKISHGVTMKILRILKEYGIVESYQGRGELTGGFTLVKRPADISLLDILDMMEGGFSLYSNQEEGSMDYLHSVLLQINNRLKAELDSCSLLNILEEQH